MFRLTRMVEISAGEYKRLLDQEIQLMKYKDMCTKKAVENKRLQDKLAYYKKQYKKSEDADEPNELEEPNGLSVNI